MRKDATTTITTKRYFGASFSSSTRSKAILSSTDDDVVPDNIDLQLPADMPEFDDDYEAIVAKVDKLFVKSSSSPSASLSGAEVENDDEEDADDADEEEDFVVDSDDEEDEDDVDVLVAEIDEKTIKVSVDADPTSINNFNLHPITVAALKKKGIETLFPIQVAALEPAQSGRDVVARAKTGTGKTLAFSLPIVEKFLREDEEESNRGDETGKERGGEGREIKDRGVSCSRRRENWRSKSRERFIRWRRRLRR
jgi:hypothetical protein